MDEYNMTPQPPDRGKGLAIAALVCGICAIAISFFLPILNLAAGIVGIVLAVNARKQGFTGGLATAGLVLSIIGTVFAAVSSVCVICLGAAIAGAGLL